MILRFQINLGIHKPLLSWQYKALITNTMHCWGSTRWNLIRRSIFSSLPMSMAKWETIRSSSGWTHGRPEILISWLAHSKKTRISRPLIRWRLMLPIVNQAPKRSKSGRNIFKKGKLSRFRICWQLIIDCLLFYPLSRDILLLVIPTGLRIPPGAFPAFRHRRLNCG